MPKPEFNPPPLPPQKNNPWTSGSFYLVAVLAAMGLIGYFNQESILFVVVGGIFALVGIGLFQLFNDQRLQENNFVKLMRIYLKDTLSMFNKKK